MVGSGPEPITIWPMGKLTIPVLTRAQAADRAVADVAGGWDRFARDTHGADLWVGATRVLIAGDTHGDRNWVRSLCRTARRHGTPVVLVVGDFGYDIAIRQDLTFLDDCERHAADNEVVVTFIRGNHDNADALDGLDELTDPDTGLVWIRPRLAWVPDGHSWTWDHTRWGALGGATSTDRQWRTEGADWWAHERPRADDAAQLPEDLDVLVTHDAPAEVNLGGRTDDPRLAALAGEDRQLISDTLRRSGATLVAHGHWHAAHRHHVGLLDRDATETSGALTYQEVLVCGLAANISGNRWGWALWDRTDGLRFGAELDANQQRATQGLPARDPEDGILHRPSRYR